MTNENPVDYLIRRCGMTRVAFTREFGFGENHLLLVAQGRKESVSPRLQASLLLALKERGIRWQLEFENLYGTQDIGLAFEKWVYDQRKQAKLPQKVLPGLGSPMSRIVRHFGSIARTAKELRVRDIHVRTYMDSPKMPAPLRQAFADTFWGEVGAKALEAQQERYFKDKGRKR